MFPPSHIKAVRLVTHGFITLKHAEDETEPPSKKYIVIQKVARKSKGVAGVITEFCLLWQSLSLSLLTLY